METLLAAARKGELPALVVVHGDRALAAPLAERLLAGLGELWGVTPQTHRFDAGVAGLVADLRTLGLFEAGKLVALHDCGLLADRAAAASLLRAVREALPWSGGADELAGAAREAALRLLRVCRLHDIDPAGAEPAEILRELPSELFGDGREAVEAARRELEPLLAAAIQAGLRGAGEDELGLLADLVRDGLPERHLMVLVESAFDPRHPLAASLAERGGLLDAGRLSKEKGDHVAGLDALVAELGRETGARIRKDALIELQRRTLREQDFRRGGPRGAIDADSSARFAAEYRKLASLASDSVIERKLVVESTEDRGDEDVWKLLDDIAEGRAEIALGKVARRLSAAEDRSLERLSLFALLATLARDVVAVGGALPASGVAPGRSASNYPAKAGIAKQLQRGVETNGPNPLAQRKPNFIYRAYRAASRMPARALSGLPALALETERRLKGDSGDPDTALAAFVVALAGGISSGPAAGAGSRARAAGGERS